MGKTILESFLGSPHNKNPKPTPDRVELDKSGLSKSPRPNVKSKEVTYLNREAHGIRVKSLVDVNNPLIYGTDVVRITKRSTHTRDILIKGTNPSGGDSGLIGGIIDDGLDWVRSKIGFKEPALSTLIATDLNSGLYDTAQEAIDAKRGTMLGRMLQETGGGKPKTLLIQGLGNTLDFGKDQLRKLLFGKPGMPAMNNVGSPIYTIDKPYSKVMLDDGYKDVVATRDTKTATVSRLTPHPVNLKGISPVYGVDKGSKIAGTDLGANIKSQKSQTSVDNRDVEVTKYDPTRPYLGTTEKRTDVYRKSLEVKRKWTTTEDSINLLDPESNKPEKNRDLELVPFWIGLISRSKKTHFRAMITGLSESISPSWNSSKFFGNPFSYYSYVGVERSLSFTLKLYALSDTELDVMWKKINKLTSYTYPIYESAAGGKMVMPPIVNFRIGDIYNKKIGYIESLSYSFPDEGTWETDIDGLIVPKLVEVSISLKFIEQPNDIYNLYGVTGKPKQTFNSNPIK